MLALAGGVFESSYDNFKMLAVFASIIFSKEVPITMFTKKTQKRALIYNIPYEFKVNVV